MSFLARRITAAIENPHGVTTVGKSGSWLLEALGGQKTATGTQVTTTSAMRATVVWRCVVLLSTLRAMLPLKVHRARPDGGSDIARDHSNYRLLAFQPNGWQTSFEWRQYSALGELTGGTSYSLLFWRKDGTLDSIVPIAPHRVVCYVTDDGTPVYQVTLYPSGRVIWVNRFELLRTWTVSDNGYVGLSPVDQCKEAIGLALGAEEYGARLMGNGGVVSGIMYVPSTLTPEAKAAAKVSWNEAHSGLGNLHKTAVLPSDVMFEPISFKSVDLQWIQLRLLSIVDFCRMWGVPPELAQHTSPVTSWGTGVESRFMAFLATTLDPQLIASEQAMQRDLFLPEEFDVVWPQYNRSALLRTDLLTRYQAYAIGRQWGWLTVNRILTREDENPVGPEGDVLLDPMNMTRLPIDPTSELRAPKAGQSGQGLQDTVNEFVRRALAERAGDNHA